MAPVEGEGRLSAHSQRTGIHDQVAAPLAVVEGEIGGLGKMRQIDGVVFAIRRQFVEEGAGLLGIAARQH